MKLRRAAGANEIVTAKRAIIEKPRRRNYKIRKSMNENVIICGDNIEARAGQGALFER